MWNIGSGVRLIDCRVEAPQVGAEIGGGEIALRGEDSLGQAGRPRRVHLHRRRRWAAPRWPGSVAVMGGQTPLVVRAGLHHLQPLRNAGGDLPGDLAVARPRDHHRAARVGDDRLELRRRQAPVERDGDGPDLAGGEQQLDDLGRGAVEVGDAVPGADAGGEQRLSQPARALVELGVGQRARRRSGSPPRPVDSPRARARRPRPEVPPEPALRSIQADRRLGCQGRPRRDALAHPWAAKNAPMASSTAGSSVG